MRVDLPDPQADRWFARRTFVEPPLGATDVVRAAERRNISVSVCLPALDEVETIGPICEAIRAELVPMPVRELIVIDSGSIDGTQDAAAAAGASVYSADDILSGYAKQGGKGAALWKSLTVASGDIIVWIDSDVTNFTPEFVTRLISPIFADDNVHLVKAYYERPMDGDGESGARVTEIAARPLINLLHPDLAGMIQPLGGECAVRRKIAVELPFFTGYGVDIGLLLDVAARYGLSSVAQIDLGVRMHANQDVFSLGRMAHQILQVMIRRLDGGGRIKLAEDLRTDLVQFLPRTDGYTSSRQDLAVEELPPIATIEL